MVDVSCSQWELDRLDWKKDAKRFAGKSFVSIDPGADGYAMGWLPEEDNPVAFCHVLEPHLVAGMARRIGAHAFVYESQYVTSLKNARHVIELTFRSAMSLGVAAECLRRDGHHLYIFEVAPSTWQAAQRRASGIEGRREKGQAAQIAFEVAQEVLGTEGEWKRSLKARKLGLASALGIGQWWRGLIGG